MNYKKRRLLIKMLIYLLSVEEIGVESSSKTIGVYKTYNLAKIAATDYVGESELEFKRKNQRNYYFRQKEMIVIIIYILKKLSLK